MLSVSAMTIVIGWALSAVGGINLELRPANQNASACNTVDVGLYAVSDSGVDQFFSAVQVVFAWDPVFFQLLGLDNSGAANLADSFFPVDDPFGLNEVVPPQDGDGMYVGFAPLGQPLAATPEGTLLTTFEFFALGLTPQTDVDLLVSGGDPPAQTKVFDAVVPGLNIVGLLSGSVAAVLELPSPDINGDLIVSPADLALVLGSWGPCPPPTCITDLNCDGVVGSADLALVLGSWGPVVP